VSVPTASEFSSAIAALGGDPAVPPAENAAVNPIIRNLFSICQSTEKCPGGVNLWPLPAPKLAGQILNSVAQPRSNHRYDSVFAKVDANLPHDIVFAYYAFRGGNESIP